MFNQFGSLSGLGGRESSSKSSLFSRVQFLARGAEEGHGVLDCLGSRAWEASTGQAVTAQPWPSPVAQGGHGDTSEEGLPFYCPVAARLCESPCQPLREAKRTGAPPPKCTPLRAEPKLVNTRLHCLLASTQSQWLVKASVPTPSLWLPDGVPPAPSALPP